MPRTGMTASTGARVRTAPVRGDYLERTPTRSRVTDVRSRSTDGGSRVSDGRLGSTDGRLGSTDGRLGSADGRLRPTDGRLRPTDGRSWASDEAPDRYTVRITGYGAESVDTRNGTRASTAQRHSQLKRYERAGFRPDRVAMWAVLLGVTMILIAAASSHAAVLAAHHALTLR